jgi:hypothetical protein
MLTDLQSSQKIRQAELINFIPLWLKALTLRVEAQELQRDTIVTYERGVRKFIH